MDKNTFIQQARNQGFTDAQINAYINSVDVPSPSPIATGASNQSIQILPDNAQAQQPQTATSAFTDTINSGVTPQAHLRHPYLDTALQYGGPILGGILGAAVPGLGETGVSEVAGAGAGGAGGQYLSDILEGRKAGGDVALSGGAGLLGGALGGIGTKILSKVLAGGAEDLATGGLNLTKGQLAKYAQKYGEGAAQTLSDAKLAGSNADTLDGAISNLGKTYSDTANQDIPINHDTFLNNAGSAIDKLRSQAPGSSKKMASAIEQEIQDNVLPALSDNPTMADINALKGQYDANTTAAQFSKDPHQWDVNRAVGNILRKTLNDTADINGVQAANGQPLSALGKTLMKLNDLNDSAGKRAGVGDAGNLFGATNEGLGVLGAVGAKAFGANPLTGLLLPGMRIGGKILRSSPAVASPLSSVLRAAGNIANKAVVPLAGVGALAGVLGANQANGQAQSVQPVLTGLQNQENNNNPESNQSSSSPSGSNIPQISSNVKGGLPDQLPAPSQLSNTIPGQPYAQEKYINDVNTIQADMQRVGPNNTTAQEALRNELSTVEAKKSANDAYISNYVAQNGLDQGQQDFVRTASPLYQNLNDLKSLISQRGGKNIAQAIANDNPIVQYFKVQTDPTGDYARMLTLMKQIGASGAKATIGGRLSNFDVQTYNSLSTGNTKAANLANLDQLQKNLYRQYTQYAPLYGLTLSQQPTQGTSPFNALQQQGVLPAGQ